MKIFVTGASGFIGNYVIDYLTNTTNHEIIATSRDKAKVEKKSWYHKINFIESDIYSTQINKFEFYQNPDLLIHLAWDKLPNYTKSFHLSENLSKDILFLENMLDNGLKNLVVTGTCFEYGIQEGELIEGMPTEPSNPYAIAKDSLRRFLTYKCSALSSRLLWLRLFYMYGEGQNPNSLIAQLESSISKGEKTFNMSGGEQIRDYLPVKKVAEYIVKCSLDKEISGILNISSGNPIKIRTFVENIIKSKDADIRLNFGFYPYSALEPMVFWGNNEKLNSLNDFKH